METSKTSIQSIGYQLVPAVFSHFECEQWLSQLDKAMGRDREKANVRESRGTVFAARNLVQFCPQVLDFWQKTVLIDLLVGVLGAQAGLVRVLFFDKPSDRSWSLPFHKDMTIAVADNSLPSKFFTKPTHKAGVDHVEAHEQLLQNMLTLRIHLDPVTDFNGPLQLIPGSHLTGKQNVANSEEPVKVLCQAGDVLAMRPLISHGSAHSMPGTGAHRRILHLEFAGIRNLPDRYEWHFFNQIT